MCVWALARKNNYRSNNRRPHRVTFSWKCIPPLQWEMALKQNLPKNLCWETHHIVRTGTTQSYRSIFNPHDWVMMTKHCDAFLPGIQTPHSELHVCHVVPLRTSKRPASRWWHQSGGMRSAERHESKWMKMSIFYRWDWWRRTVRCATVPGKWADPCRRNRPLCPQTIRHLIQLKKKNY